MTQIEAKEACKNGEKITNRYFSDDEYITFKKGSFYFEDDVLVPEDWWLKEYTWSGWSIKK